MSSAEYPHTALSTAAIWLVLDVGNSSVKGGVFQGDTLRHAFRLPSGAARPDPDYHQLLQAELSGITVARAGIASVVPVRTAVIAEAVRRVSGLAPEPIGVDRSLPFRMAYETPETLGVDRVAAAAAGFVRYGKDANGASRSVLVVDAGTATTYEVIDREGVYQGGAITAGPALVQKALAAGTAQLPTVAAELPATPIGRTTRQALQSGTMFGFIDAVSGMLDRMAAATQDEPVVVATGGWSAFLAEHLGRIHYVEPDLVLHGVRILMELNQP